MMPRKGFTYVELVVVVTIIMILAAIAVPNFMEAQIRSTVARTKCDMAALEAGIEAYRLETRRYPLNRERAVPNGWDLVCVTTPIAYLTHLPFDYLTTREARGATISPGNPNLSPPIPYRYLNGLQIDPVEGLRLEGGATGGFDASGSMVVLLWGIGPARQQRMREPSEDKTSPAYRRYVEYGTQKPEYREATQAEKKAYGDSVSRVRVIRDGDEPNTLVTREGEVATFPYDPTNGTTSRGDIYGRLP